MSFPTFLHCTVLDAATFSGSLPFTPGSWAIGSYSWRQRDEYNPSAFLDFSIGNTRNHAIATFCWGNQRNYKGKNLKDLASFVIEIWSSKRAWQILRNGFLARLSPCNLTKTDIDLRWFLREIRSAQTYSGYGSCCLSTVGVALISKPLKWK